MRVERAGPRDYIAERHLGPSRVRFNPKMKLDLSQIRDIRGARAKPGILSYMQSTMKAARSVGPTTSAQRTTQFRARQRLLKPYRNLRIGAMKMRGGR